MFVGFTSLFAVALFAGFVVWIMALIDVLRTPESSFKTGQDRLIWVVVVVFLNFVGAALWYFVGRQALVGPTGSQR